MKWPEYLPSFDREFGLMVVPFKFIFDSSFVKILMFVKHSLTSLSGESLSVISYS